MDAAAPKLDLVRPDPQFEFPWLNPATKTALALPLADIGLWHYRPKYRTPGYYCVQFKIRDDVRYHALLEATAAEGLDFEACKAALADAAGCAILQERPGLLAQAGQRLGAERIRRFWRYPDATPEQLKRWDHYLHACKRVGWFKYCDLNDSMEVRLYDFDPKRNDDERARTCTNAHARVDGQTDRQTDRPAGTESSRRLTVPESDPALSESQRIQKALRDSVAAIRRNTTHEKWPDCTDDVADLREAVVNAMHSKRIMELRELLLRLAPVARHGGLFHKSLRDAGFIRGHRL